MKPVIRQMFTHAHDFHLTPLHLPELAVFEFDRQRAFFDTFGDPSRFWRTSSRLLHTWMEQDKWRGHKEIVEIVWSGYFGLGHFSKVGRMSFGAEERARPLLSVQSQK